MSVLGIRWKAETLRSASAAAITTGATGFVPVGSATGVPANQIYLVNLTNAFLVVSLDGINDHIPMPAGSNFFVDIASNKSNPTSTLMMASNTQIWVAYEGVANPTVGEFYASVFYAAPFAP
jgi:hypothetical protein